MNHPELRFKIADTEHEFEQIHRLNYKTFVKEIPQHAANPDEKLVDQFHHENTYVIGLAGGRLIGMVAVRANRPFSLDKKLENLDSYLPRDRRVCEVRLLAVESDARKTFSFAGLFKKLLEYCRSKGYDLAVISGTTGQLKLYQHMGFLPFAHRVGTETATFQPMYITAENLEKQLDKFLTRNGLDFRGFMPVNLLPGPVEIHPSVSREFQKDAVSHRSRSFLQDLERTKSLLCSFVNSDHVQILVGSGSLANDCVAAQLSLTGQKGLILSNGEFGERLIDHATRQALDFETVRVDWGRTFDPRVLRKTLSERTFGWLWAVHCETSTGVLNDLNELKSLSGEFGVRLCVDCISSIGTVPVDLNRVAFASCVSGKGIGSYPGLSMVFHDRPLTGTTRLPRYLDLGFYAEKGGVPFTHSSNLVYALKKATENRCARDRYTDLVALNRKLRAELTALGLSVITPAESSSPAVITLALPEACVSGTLGQQLEESGILISYASDYLLKRNWIQICLMSDVSADAFAGLVRTMKTLVSSISEGASNG